jgi:molybdopterin-guanine dinucleotide biosynthesis protein A
MGRDKALVELGAKTLAAHAVELLRSAGLSATIAGARSELGDLAPVIADEGSDQGPLRGICSALGSTDAELAVFVPVDLPLLPASLLRYLVHHARITGDAVTLASVNGFAQTFPSVLHKDALPTLQEELAAERGGCFAAFHTAAMRLGQAVRVVTVEVLVQTGSVTHDRAVPPFRWFLNVNTLEDAERARLHIA